MKDLHELTEDLVKRVRGLCIGLRSLILDDLGLASALRWLFDEQISRAGLEGHVEVESLAGARFPGPVETACFRIAQESLFNVARPCHARAKMEERAHLLNGDFEIASAPGHGSEVRVSLPVAGTQHNDSG